MLYEIVEVRVPKLSKGISNMLMLTESHQYQLRIVYCHRHLRMHFDTGLNLANNAIYS